MPHVTASAHCPVQHVACAVAAGPRTLAEKPGLAMVPAPQVTVLHRTGAQHAAALAPRVAATLAMWVSMGQVPP
eukprot:COSAG01_NODE_38941_length_483_cov_0.924479_2_plen_73_part_01